MRGILRLYHFINILSIDIVAGAIISALFFAKIFQVQVRPFGLMALGLTVWVIYTIDHLRDAKKISHQAATKRHRFHQQYFNILFVLLCITILVDSFVIFFIRRQVFEWGFVLLFIVIFYLMAYRSLRFLKEILIASLYTWGVLVLSIPVTTIKLHPTHYLLITQFAIIAWINLVMFAWFDQEYDLRDNQNSFVTVFGKRVSFICLNTLFVLNFLLAFIQIFLQGPTLPVLILLVMNTVLFLIFLFRGALAKNDVYRLIGDAVFLFPILFLL